MSLDPFAGTEDPNRPLLNELLAVPSLRLRRLERMRNFTGEWPAWSKICLLAQQYHSLIAADVKSDRCGLLRNAVIQSCRGRFPFPQPASCFYNAFTSTHDNLTCRGGGARARDWPDRADFPTF